VKTPGIPPTAVGGLFKPGLQRERAVALFLVIYLSPLAARGEREEKPGIPGVPLCRLALNNPPTGRGWYSRSFYTASSHTVSSQRGGWWMADKAISSAHPRPNHAVKEFIHVLG
jgi:hypothetical protein